MIKTETFSADFVITATKQTLVRTGKSKRVRRNIRLRLVDDKSDCIPTHRDTANGPSAMDVTRTTLLSLSPGTWSSS